MFVTISIDDIIRRVYAESALRFAVAEAGSKPSVLIRDNEPVLRRLTIDVFFDTVGQLADKVTDFGPQPTPDDTDILYIEFEGQENPAAGALLSSAIYNRLTAAVYAESAPARTAAATAAAAAAVDSLVGTTRPAWRCGLLRPSL